VEKPQQNHLVRSSHTVKRDLWSDFELFFLNALLTHKIVTTVLQEKKIVKWKKKDHAYTYSKAI